MTVAKAYPTTFFLDLPFLKKAVKKPESLFFSDFAFLIDYYRDI